MPSFRTALDNFQSPKFKILSAGLMHDPAPFKGTDHIFKYFKTPDDILQFSQSHKIYFNLDDTIGLFSLTSNKPGFFSEPEFLLGEFNDYVAKYMTENADYLSKNGIDTSKFFELYSKQAKFEKLMSSSPDIDSPVALGVGALILLMGMIAFGWALCYEIYEYRAAVKKQAQKNTSLSNTTISNTDKKIT